MRVQKVAFRNRLRIEKLGLFLEIEAQVLGTVRKKLVFELVH
jgi:hypothetical protein